MLTKNSSAMSTPNKKTSSVVDLCGHSTPVEEKMEEGTGTTATTAKESTNTHHDFGNLERP